MAAKILKNDEVIVVAGKDAGKQGKVTEVRADGKIFVEGVNLIKKHQKPNPQLGVAGGIISGKNMGPTKFLMGSTATFFGGKPAARLTSMTGQNGSSNSSKIN